VGRLVDVQYTNKDQRRCVVRSVADN
jgi:hypothetical protein